MSSCFDSSNEVKDFSKCVIPWLFYPNQQFLQYETQLQLLTMDISALITMKNAAKCDM